MVITKTTPKKILDKLPFPISGRAKAYRDPVFVAGDSPVTLDVNTDLGRNAIDGFIINDGAGIFNIEISDDGANWSNEFRLNNGETLQLTNVNIDSIKLTWLTNSSYRALFI